MSLHPDEPAVIVGGAHSEAVVLDAVQGPLHQFVVFHDQADHPDGRAAPGAVVVHPVEELRIPDRYEIGERAKEILLQCLPILFG